ncbi:alpha/beta hydrolase family protein [Actinomycetospora sp. CA-084318]|uniref:alpha/beta hydrolase family protein n=1 Tax=Actinomycetospora sp. CA-084318 TaxID=3239892 RepID=UPI003D9632FD
MTSRLLVPVLAAAVLLGVTTACAPKDPPAPCAPGDRGRLLSVAPTHHLDRSQLSQALAGAHLTGGALHGVDEYQVRYCTVAADATPTVASGLLALPDDEPGERPLVVYEHSTVTAAGNVPSARPSGDGLLAPPYFATAGFAVAAPDYLGLGSSPGPHPFMQASTEASATLDLLPAVERAGVGLGVALSHDVLLTGHSQGGAAAMATGEAMQQQGGPWRLRALAPMAGPYDLAGAELPAITDPRAVDPHRASAYLAYLLLAWDRLYPLGLDPRQMFAVPAADEIAHLFDGTHDFTQIAAALPAPQQLLAPAALALVEHPTAPFAAALEANEVCRWRPDVPVRLYAGHGDRDVVYANSTSCRDQLRVRGGDAVVEDMGGADHVGTAIAALPAIRTWFAELSRP